MGATACKSYPLNRRFADEAGFAATHVDLVLELEEAADSIGIDVVRDGRAAKLDRVTQNCNECLAEA